MTIQLPIVEFSPEQRELWTHVVHLWELSKRRGESEIRAALHPEYVGWDTSSPLPHDRDAAMRSVSGESPELREYALQPLSVQVYQGRVGVVHYSYSAVVARNGEQPISATGKWSEIYLRQGGEWVLIAVSGRPDAGQGSGREARP
jgi:hypothetical protein